MRRMNEITKINSDTFENIKHINEYNQEYWNARELQSVLKYSEWNYARTFANA